VKVAPSTEGRQIYWRTVFILAMILLAVSGAGFVALYQMTYEDTREQLVELAQAQGRMMESVAKYDAFHNSGQIKGSARSATISQFKEGYRANRGFGTTGEVLLGERVGDELVYLLPSRKLGFQIPSPVSIAAKEAGPMDAAVRGESGTMQGLDYSGDKVLAAYQWLPFMEMGLVTKIDVTEINRPFFRAAMFTVLLAFLAILIGAALNARAVSPLIKRILKSAAIIREREATYRELVDTLPGIVYRSETDDDLTMREVGGSSKKMTGRPAAAFVDNAELRFLDIVVPEDRPRAVVADEGTFNLDYRIEKPDGEIRWIADNGTVSKDENGQLVRKGILLDITARKAAEHALEELPRKLSRYISPQVYKSIFQGEQDAQVGNTRKKLTIFFSDVVNFTMKSESLDPDDLTYIVNSYLNRMAELAIEHGGTLDKFIGDGVVIFFGDPETRGVENDARACMNMGLEMLDAVETLNKEALRHGINSPIAIRIGMATGYCTVGNFGSESRMDYTVMGKTVNLAARLEAAAPTQGILISSETLLLVDEEFISEPAEPILVKGFEKPVAVHQVTGKKS
jgi:class 3 adenylate cyclase/PAS domain-containing protein